MASSGGADVAVIGERIMGRLNREPLVKAQYIAIVDADNLASLERLDGRRARIIMAAYVGETRLIDNWPLENYAR